MADTGIRLTYGDSATGFYTGMLSASVSSAVREFVGLIGRRHIAKCKVVSETFRFYLGKQTQIVIGRIEEEIEGKLTMRYRGAVSDKITSKGFGKFPPIAFSTEDWREWKVKKLGWTREGSWSSPMWFTGTMRRELTGIDKKEGFQVERCKMFQTEPDGSVSLAGIVVETSLTEPYAADLPPLYFGERYHTFIDMVRGHQAQGWDITLSSAEFRREVLLPVLKTVRKQDVLRNLREIRQVVKLSDVDSISNKVCRDLALSASMAREVYMRDPDAMIKFLIRETGVTMDDIKGMTANEIVNLIRHCIESGVLRSFSMVYGKGGRKKK